MHDVLRDTPIYQMILQEGREEGIEKGRKEILEFQRMGVLNLVEARFPALKKLAKEQVAQIESPQVLVDLMVKVSLTQSLEEVIDYLVNWKTIYKDQL